MVSTVLRIFKMFSKISEAFPICSILLDLLISDRYPAGALTHVDEASPVRRRRSEASPARGGYWAWYPDDRWPQQGYWAWIPDDRPREASPARRPRPRSASAPREAAPARRRDKAASSRVAAPRGKSAAQITERAAPRWTPRRRDEGVQTDGPETDAESVLSSGEASPTGSETAREASPAEQPPPKRTWVPAGQGIYHRRYKV